METTIKAHGGDRAKNLEGIAQELSDEAKRIGAASTPGRKLRHISQQLRIIAEEWRYRQTVINAVAETMDCLKAIIIK